MVSPALAQKYCNWDTKGTEHLIKTNLLNIPLKTFSLEYERILRPNISLGIDISFTPNRNLPLKSKITENITNENAIKSVEEARFNQLSVIPQARFYFGERDVFTRFYALPYIKYSRYQANTNLHYDYVDNTGSPVSQVIIPISGNMNTLSAGIAVGLQFHIIKSIYLDWKIIGTHYGFAFGEGSGKSTGPLPLSQDLQDNIKESLQKLDDLPFYSFPYTVTDNTVELKPKGLNLGITSAVSIGYRF